MAPEKEQREEATPVGASAPDATPGSPPDGGDPGSATDVGTSQAVVLAPEILAESLGEFLGACWKRIRGGESGALPILVGLVVIVVFFQIQNSHFLTAGNIVNLMNEAAFFILLGMAEVFVLLLAEIDLSVGFVAAVGGAITAALISSPYNWPWWAGLILGLLASAAIGMLQGILITRLHLPSFVVTLGGLLFWAGFLIFIFDLDKGSVGGVITITNNVVYNLVNGDITPLASWILLVIFVGLYAFLSISRAARRRAKGLSAPPISITIATILVVAAAGIALVVICNLNRGVLGVSLRGVPWVVLFVLAVILAWSWLLGKTRFGRYIYAIGGSPEAARRAGINVAWVRTFAFTLSGFTAGLAGIVYESRLGSISVGFDGGTYVLYAVAAAVIGGTSLLGGRGKALHPLLGGLVIAVVANGLALLNISTAGTEMATALVLLAAVTVDSVVRRRSAMAR
jgi:D-xylose transport system permease protein